MQDPNIEIIGAKERIIWQSHAIFHHGRGIITTCREIGKLPDPKKNAKGQNTKKEKQLQHKKQGLLLPDRLKPLFLHPKNERTNQSSNQKDAGEYSPFEVTLHANALSKRL